MRLSAFLPIFLSQNALLNANYANMSHLDDDGDVLFLYRLLDCVPARQRLWLSVYVGVCVCVCVSCGVISLVLLALELIES